MTVGQAATGFQTASPHMSSPLTPIPGPVISCSMESYWIVVFVLSCRFRSHADMYCMAGRVGSAFAAELGTMVVSEQTDSLRVLKSDPVDYLISPRVLACMVATPILNLLCFCMGECAVSLYIASFLHNRDLRPLQQTSISLLIYQRDLPQGNCSKRHGGWCWAILWRACRYAWYIFEACLVHDYL